MGSEETFVIVVERYMRGTEPLLLHLNGDEIGVPVFGAIEEAGRFLEAFWEVLGPGFEAVKVSARELEELLVERCVGRAGCAIISPPPTLAGGWRVMDLWRFAEALGGGEGG